MQWHLFTVFDVVLCVVASLLLVGLAAVTEGVAPTWSRLAALLLAAVYFARGVSPNFDRTLIELGLSALTLVAIIVLARRLHHAARAQRRSDGPPQRR